MGGASAGVIIGLLHILVRSWSGCSAAELAQGVHNNKVTFMGTPSQHRDPGEPLLFPVSVTHCHCKILHHVIIIQQESYLVAGPGGR